MPSTNFEWSILLLIPWFVNVKTLDVNSSNPFKSFVLSANLFSIIILLNKIEKRNKAIKDTMRYLKELSSPEAISDQLLQLMAAAS